MKIGNRTRWLSIAGTVSVLAGTLLAAIKITFDGEPGALPLLLILIGVAVLVVADLRRRRSARAIQSTESCNDPS